MDCGLKTSISHIEVKSAPRSLKPASRATKSLSIFSCSTDLMLPKAVYVIKINDDPSESAYYLALCAYFGTPALPSGDPMISVKYYQTV